MANFHEDLLVITAREQGMTNVLKRIALNLAANNKITNFDISRIDGLNNPRYIFHIISVPIDNHYMCAFTGAPLPSAIEEAQADGWNSPTSSADSFKTVTAALHAALANSNIGDGVKFAITSPVGRGMSDTASVDLSKINDVWALSINYSTAWRPNSEDIDDLFLGLPKGEYGVAFYDSDEYDDTETINVFSGIHRGRAPMHNVDSVFEDQLLDADTLKVRNSSATDGFLLDIDGLDRIATVYADRSWNDWPIRFSEDEYYDEDDWEEEDEKEDEREEASEDLDTRTITTFRTFDRLTYDCASLSGEEVILLTGELLDKLPQSPMVIQLTSLDGEEAVARCLSLMPGDTILLEMCWPDNPDQPVTLSASTLNGSIFSQVECEKYGIGPPYGFSISHLACLLSHLRATVWNVGKPRKSGNTRNVKIEVRLELEEPDVTTIPERARKLLNIDRAHRVAATICTEED